MAGEEAKVVLNVEGRVSTLERQLQKLRTSSVADLSAMDRAARTSGASLDKFGRSMNGLDTRKLREAREAFSGGILKTESLNLATAGFSALRGGIAGLAATLSVGTIAGYVDEITSLSNKLRGAGLDATQSAVAQERIIDIARRSRTEVGAVGDLYAKLSLSSKDLGASQADVAKATEVVSKALKLGGASASETSSAILQLGQALSSGSLQGDELRSLLENAPQLAQVIAKSFGVAVGQLKNLGAEGQLSASKVLQAIVTAGPEIDRTFARTTRTFADSAIELKNATIAYVASILDATRESAAHAAAVDQEREALDKLRESYGLLATAQTATAKSKTETRLGAELVTTEQDINNVTTSLRAAVVDLERFGAITLNADQKAALVRTLTEALNGDKEAADRAVVAIEALGATNPAAGPALSGLKALAEQLGIVRRQAANAAEALASISSTPAAQYKPPEFLSGASKAADAAAIVDSEAIANRLLNDRLVESKLDANAVKVRAKADALRKELLSKGLAVPGNLEGFAGQITTNEDARSGGGGSAGRSADDERAASIKRVVEALAEEGRAAQAEAAAFSLSNGERRAAIELARLQVDGSTAEGQAIVKAAMSAEQYRTALEGMKQAQEASRQAGQFFGNTIFEALDGVLIRGTKAKDALAGLARQIASAALQASLLGSGPLSGLFGGKASGGGLGGVLGALFSGLTGSFGSGSLYSGASAAAVKFHSGGLVGAGGQAVRIPAAAFASAPRFHNGLKADEMAAILQRGERVLTARQNDRMGDLVTGLTSATEGRGSGPAVVQNISIAPNTDLSAVAKLLPEMKKAAIDGVRDAIARGKI